MNQIIVDCEASGLSSDSYPIQIAWLDVHTGETDTFYIKPAESWTHWDENAEEVHNIPKQLLRDVGLDVTEAAHRFLSALEKGDRQVYSDAPDFESFWLSKLLNTSGIFTEPVRLYVRHVIDLVEPEYQKRMSDIMCDQVRPHDALEDCRMIYKAVQESRLTE